MKKTFLFTIAWLALVGKAMQDDSYDSYGSSYDSYGSNSYNNDQYHPPQPVTTVISRPQNHLGLLGLSVLPAMLFAGLALFASLAMTNMQMEPMNDQMDDLEPQIYTANTNINNLCNKLNSLLNAGGAPLGALTIAPATPATAFSAQPTGQEITAALARVPDLTSTQAAIMRIQTKLDAICSITPAVCPTN